MVIEKSTIPRKHCPAPTHYHVTSMSYLIDCCFAVLTSVYIENICTYALRYRHRRVF